MSSSSVGPGGDRSKRHKSDASTMGGPPPPPPPPDGYGGYGQMPPQGRYQQPPYGPGGPMPPQSSYNMWQHGQYGNAPPPPSWGHSSPPPPGGMYPQRPGMGPDRGGYGPGYRGPPPMHGTSAGQPARRTPKQGPPSRPGSKTPEASAAGPGGSGGDAPPVQPGYQNGWTHGHPQGGQWAQHQWGSGPPSVWQSGGPPMHQTPGYGGGPGMWSGNSSSPSRTGQRPRSSPDGMGGYGGPPGSFCQSADNPDMDMYGGRSVGPHDDDGNSTSGGMNSKDKGRGSYKCGRCGVPKKGHVCPYQPKMKRRPGEPLPVMRSAAIQVEMDEFLTLRRLNLRIQGFPESYATEPYMADDMVVGEPHPLAVASASPPHVTQDVMTLPEGQPPPPPPHSMPPQENPEMLNSPIRSSPVATEDPITGAA